MNTYIINYSFRRNSQSNWTTTTATINATSDLAAISIIMGKYPEVKINSIKIR